MSAYDRLRNALDSGGPVLHLRDDLVDVMRERDDLKAKLAEVTAERDAFARACGEMDKMQAEALVAIGQQRKRIETALAASQAHAAELRAALRSYVHAYHREKHPGYLTYALHIMPDARDRAAAALARESSTDALREFGRRVVEHRDSQSGGEASPEECVAAVIRGDAHD